MDYDEPGKKKKHTTAEALAKIYRYCAYQERSHHEVKDRLFSYGLHLDEVDQILSKLITDGFVNEERFAKAFAGGKFRVKKWGRLKIERELDALGLSRNCIKSGMKEIEADDYEITLRQVLSKKEAGLDETNVFVKRDKIAKYAIGKGYEPELVWKFLKELIP